jgi:DNA-binding NarL/FixJ family response regulator
LIHIRHELDLERHANSTPLTQREREVLDLVAQGCTSREIGERLGIAAGTVDCEVNGAMAKLTARTRTHAAFLAATPAAPAGPLFVLEEPTAEVFDALFHELTNAGWDVGPDWDILDNTNGIAPPGTVCVGTVRSTEDARSALAAAVSGAGLIVSARAALLERLIRDLQGLCAGAGREKSLSDDERRLLALLAAGISVSEAARRLYISRRTAERRLRAARRALGVRTTTEAVMAVGRSQRGRLLHIVRAS